MEISGTVFRSTPFFPGVGFDTHTSKSFFSSSLSFDVGKLKLSGCYDRHRFSAIRHRVFSGISNSGFSDEGGGTKKKKKKKKNPEIAKIKKKVKLIKGLSKDLSTFSSIGFGLETEDGLVGEIKKKEFSEATEVLLAQLKMLRTEEKEMKRKSRKEEKARLKASNSSSSSDDDDEESSNNECEEVVDMRIESLPAACSMNEVQVKEDNMRVQDEGSSNVIVVKPSSSSSSHRIEVCMGSKCRKSGAATLLEEIERKVGVGGTVVGCKCMGKCKDGPNVRVLNKYHHEEKVVVVVVEEEEEG